MSIVSIKKISKVHLSVDEAIFILWYALFFLGDSVFKTMPVVVYIGGYLCIGVLAFFLILIRGKEKHIVNRSIFLCIFISALHLISIIYNGNAHFVEIVYTWGFMGVALLLFLGKIREKSISICLYGVLIYLTIVALLGVDPQDVFRGSRNSVSAQIIFILILFYLFRFREQKSIVFFPAIYTIALCIWGGGRTGLLISIFFVVGLFVYNWLFVKHKKAKTLISVSCLALGIAFAIRNIFIEFYVEIMTRFTTFGLETLRTEIWAQYIHSLSESANLFFGAPTINSNYTLLATYEGNLHNSFLQLHSCYGLLVFMGIMICIGLCFYRAICKREFYYCILLMVIVLRAFFDWTAFPGSYEILFYYFIILFVIKKEKRTRGNITVDIVKTC